MEYCTEDRDVSLLAKDQYLREVRWLSRLSKEEELMLLQWVVRGNEERGKACPDGRVLSVAKHARDRLVEHYQPLVLSIARRYNGLVPAYELLDLVNEGNLGLLAALEKAQDGGVKRFGVYAYRYINGSILLALRDRGELVHFGYSMWEKLSALRRAREQVHSQVHREPTAEELAEEMKLSKEEVKQLLIYECRKEVGSLEGLFRVDQGEEERNAEEQLVLKSLYQQEQAPTGREAQLREAVRQAMEQVLTTPEREVIRLRYGFVGAKEWTQQQIATELGLKWQAVVRKHEHKARAKLCERLACLYAVAQEELAV